MRYVQEREYCHERLGNRFADALCEYDTRCRMDVLVDDFLSGVRGLEVLDVGCGLGHFSERLSQRGAIVTACDIGPTLVRRTCERVGCEAVCADALALVQCFGRERFDVVLSSECIEHTPAPEEAIRQMTAVLRPGGYLSLSTPNLLWSPVVKLATLARWRPFDGLENFSTWSRLRRTLRDARMTIERERGLHLIPFQLKCYRLSRWLDRHCQWARWLMINLCILARKG